MVMRQESFIQMFVDFVVVVEFIYFLFTSFNIEMGIFILYRVINTHIQKKKK